MGEVRLDFRDSFSNFDIASKVGDNVDNPTWDKRAHRVEARAPFFLARKPRRCLVKVLESQIPDIRIIL